MYKRCEKPAPDTTIDLSVFGDPCDIYQNMLNRIEALRRLQSQWPLCDITRFDVQFQLVNANAYMFTIFDKANSERYEWTVEKEYTKESPEHAFERDYNDSMVRYNAGALRALDDYLEAIQENDPSAYYRKEETTSGHRVWRPIRGGLGLVPFEFSVKAVNGPAIQPRVLHPEIWEYIGNIPGEAGRSIARMVKRLIKRGVVFDKAERTIVKDYRKVTLSGTVFRNAQTHNVVTITMQEIALSDGDLFQYHQYFTE